MPELPEVETIKRLLVQQCQGLQVKSVKHFRDSLRWPIPDLTEVLPGQILHNIKRRAKYLLLEFDTGRLMVHLGMSGYLQCIQQEYRHWVKDKRKHDHFVLSLVKPSKAVVTDVITDLQCVLNDARRFGSVLWLDYKNYPEYNTHKLLSKLGPEPVPNSDVNLAIKFNVDYLKNILAKRHAPIKTMLMNNNIVVGVGNIYANEALFRSKIHPLQPANTIAKHKLVCLVESIEFILHQAIMAGGTTLRDYRHTDGKPGYFQQKLLVYARVGKACVDCGDKIVAQTIGQRMAFYCPKCQAIR